jgi:hypothetical protein
MEVTLAEQAIFLLPVHLTQEQAREKALEQTFNVFAMISKFLARPKGEEIQIGLSEFRYTPFWHALGHRRFRFERGTRYQVPVSAHQS